MSKINQTRYNKNQEGDGDIYKVESNTIKEREKDEVLTSIRRFKTA